MPITVAVLGERVNDHIKFVWALMGVGFTWLIGISVFLFNMNGTMNRVERAQVNAPAQIVARLLSRPAATKEEASDALLATTVVLKQSKPWASQTRCGSAQAGWFRISKISGKVPRSPGGLASHERLYQLPICGVTAIPVESRRQGVLCQTTLRGKGLIFENCEISLEDLDRRFYGNEAGQAPVSFYFVNCIVNYNGGPILARISHPNLAKSRPSWHN